MPDQSPTNITSRLEELADQDIEEVLRAPVVPQSKNQALGNILAGQSEEEDRSDWLQSAAFTGLEIGDLIYDISRIDPRALEAADFSRVEDLSNVFEYSHFAARMSDRSGASLEGTLNRQEGYVAERFAAQQQQSMGKEVEIPDEANQEGYDLLINGEKFQVKAHSDASGIREHLNEHPDIPVLVNQDLTEEIGGHPDVYPVPGMNQEMIEEATASSLEAGSEMLDFEVPAVALAVSTGRHIKGMLEGKTDLKAALPNIAFDFGGGVAGGAAGGYVGAEAMALAGMLFGPAGAVVGGIAGSVLGFSQGKRVARVLRREIFCADQEQALEEALQNYLDALRKASADNLEVVERKHAQLRDALRGGGAFSETLREKLLWRVEQEYQYRDKKAEELKEAIEEPHLLDPNGSDLLVGAAEGTRLMTTLGVHPHALSAELSSIEEKSAALLEERERYLA
jgi:hypothetical protein